ncbi:MAG: hypothetical protein ACTS8R_07235 [Arsenophonus sp. NC-QC1-MAG3]
MQIEFGEVAYLKGKAKAIILATGRKRRIYQLTINAHISISMRYWNRRMADISLQDMKME